MALIKQANDANEMVKMQVSEAIQDVGRQLPELVLSSLLEFVKKEGKGRKKQKTSEPKERKEGKKEGKKRTENSRTTRKERRKEGRAEQKASEDKKEGKE